MKRAPKKPILKPFEEEQQSPMGHQHRAPAGIESLSFCRVLVKAFSDCCSSRQTWREQNVVIAVLFTILHIQLRTLTKRFCKQRKNKKPRQKDPASIQKQTRPNNEPYRVFFFSGEGACTIWAHRGGRGASDCGTNQKSGMDLQGHRMGKKVTMGGDFPLL